MKITLDIPDPLVAETHGVLWALLHIRRRVIVGPGCFSPPDLPMDTKDYALSIGDTYGFDQVQKILTALYTAIPPGVPQMQTKPRTEAPRG